MRHRVKGRKLGRTKAHREATLRALGSALIKEHRIQTTLPKAKELRTFIEPLITIAKEDNTHNRRKAFSYLQDKVAVTELFNEVGPAAADRPGGYTRVLKLGHRLGDSADMAVIELVDFNDVQPESKSQKKRRTRRGGGSSSGTSKAAATENKKSGKEPEAQEAQAEEAVQSAETEVLSDENQKEVQKENIDDSAKADVQEDVSADSATSSEDSDSAEETNSSEEEEKSDK